jgi:hypothetical protein
LLRYFFFIAENLDQFPFVDGGAHGGRRGENLFCDYPPNLEFIRPDIGALAFGKPENKNANRFPAQEKDASTVPA